MFFTFFPNFNFQSQLWVKTAKNCVKFNCVFCCASLKWWHLLMVFSFFKILVFWVVKGVGDKGQIFFSFFQNSDFYGFSKFINKCQKKIWGVPHLPHICMIFCLCYNFIRLYFNKVRLGKEEKGKCLVTTHLLQSKASG